MRRIIKKIFGIRDCVYITQHAVFVHKEIEDALIKEANAFIVGNFKKWAGERMEYVEGFNSEENIFSILTTFNPDKSKSWGIIMYEVYAFIKTLDLKCFKDYQVEQKRFGVEGKEVIVYKIKI